MGSRDNVNRNCGRRLRLSRTTTRLEQARVAAAAQRPGTAALFTDVAGPAAWRTVPSWALVSTQDRAINPDLLRFMAKRAKAKTIEVASSHASILSHPGEVAGLILAAARAGDG
jgi:pimeloyl-ACP methyl ester carboxylesterase